MYQMTLAALVAALALVQPGFDHVKDKKTLTLEGAKKVAAAAADFARSHGAGGTIAVVDDGGNLVYLERIDGTFAASAMVSIGKARTSALFRKPTSFFEKVVNEGRTTMVALPDFTPLQGGVPIEVDGEIVGAVGVSGAKSAQQDEEVAVAGAMAVKTTAMTGDGAVTHLGADAVAKAFVKGAALFENGEYKVHASHREAAGVPEVHVADTDIIHVLSGTATFVTGGTVAGPKTVAADEIRGTDIAGGETRQLQKGDVIIVPAGVPHWFKSVAEPVDYYVVKVTRCGGARQ